MFTALYTLIHYLFSLPHSLPQSASTTWMTYFMRLKHVNDNNPALLGMSKRAREQKKYLVSFVLC